MHGQQNVKNCKINETSWISCFAICDTRVNSVNYVQKFEIFSIDRYECEVICIILRV